MLLPKPEKAGVVSPEDLKVLAKVMGVDNKGTELPKESTPPSTTVKVGRRSVLDGKRYGPGNRPYWDMKEGQQRSRYPNLIRALAREQDPGFQRRLWESHKRVLDEGRGLGGTSRIRIEQLGTGALRQ